MMKQKSCTVFAAGLMQILFAVWLFYIAYLQFIFKSKVIMIVMLISGGIHFLMSSIGLLRFENPGRILSVSNLLSLSIIAIGGMLYVGIGRLIFFLFWLAILCVSIYFAYFLTRPNIKQQFKNTR